MRRLLMVLVSVLGLVLPAAATSLSDFSKAYKIETTGSSAYYAVSVPISIYAGVHKTKLEDLRFFSSDRVMLPHAVFRRFIDPAYEEPVETMAAINFSVKPEGLVLDLSGIGRAPGRVDIKWQQPAAISAVEISQDGKKWQTLLDGAQTAQVSLIAGELTRLVVPTITSRYVRLKTSGKAAQLSAALPANLAADADPQRMWLNLNAHRAGTGEYLLDGGGFMPFDRFKLKLADGRRAHVKLYARNNSTEAWQLLTDDTFYRYRFGSEVVAKDTVLLKPAARRYLKIVTDQPFWQGSALAAGWMPDRMVFVAQGKPPYIVAFGSDKVEKLDPRTQPQLMNLTNPESDKIGVATVGKAVGTGSRMFLILAFLLVMALVAVCVWVVLRRPEDDSPEQPAQAQDD